MDDLYPILRPQQPVRPFWMGDCQDNERWEVIQGDALAYFIQVFCDCPTFTPDITGYVFQFTVKASLDATDPNELLAVVWNEQHGVCGFTALIVMPLATAQLPSGRYAFDVKSRSPGGIVRTMKRGELDVLPSTNLDMVLSVNPFGTRNQSLNRTPRAIGARQASHARLIGG